MQTEEQANSPWTVTKDLPCLNCDYNLRSLTGPIIYCPECGKDNDLTDPQKWAPREELQGYSRAYHFMITGFMTCFTATCMYLLFTDQHVFLSGFMALMTTLFWIGSCKRLIRNEIRAKPCLAQVMAGLCAAILIPTFPIAMILITHRYQEHIPIEAPFLILPGMAVSLFLYLALRRIVPEPGEQELREWMCYCDAIIDRYSPRP